MKQAILAATAVGITLLLISMAGDFRRYMRIRAM